MDSSGQLYDARHRSAIAWFISPHGFGHAARASAIIEACSRHRPLLRHHLFTTVPPSFFAAALNEIDHVLHTVHCDVGMVQRTPFVEDIDATVAAVERLPLDGGPELERLVETARATGCRIVVSDIAPLGLVVADRLGVPSVLVANFTWDWIYRNYGDDRLAAIAGAVAPIFRSATRTVATEPVCPGLAESHRVPPVSRAPRRDRDEVRRGLGVAPEERVVLVSLSGLDRGVVDPRELPLPPDVVALIPHRRAGIEVRDRVIRIPAEGGPYHPDLVAASDLVIGKLGYSTVAEVYHADTAFAYLTRPRFPESPVLEAFVDEHVRSAPLSTDWPRDPLSRAVVGRLLETGRRSLSRTQGADRAARLIVELDAG